MKRYANVEIMRFVAGVIIMTFHLSFVGIPRGTHRFSESYIWVEFFFILMGYFTIAHFDRNQFTDIDEKAKAAILYTKRKAMSFYPYAALSVCLYSFLDFTVHKYEIADWVSLFFDITMLTGSFNNQKAMNGVLWFLTAIIIIYPAFCLLCQIKARNLLYIFAFYVTILFYGYNDYIEYTRAPMSIVRAMVGGGLGILVYAMVNKIKKQNWENWQKALLTLVEIGSLAFAILLDYRNKSFYRLSIICFMVGISIMLSQKSYTGLLKGHIWEWLGRISMTMYFFHPVVAKYIQFFCPKVVIEYRICLYYIGTIVFSFGMWCIVEKIRKELIIKMSLLKKRNES